MRKLTLPEKLSVACKILVMEGHGDFHLGHMSARIYGEKNQLLFKCAEWGLEETTSENLITIDIDGNKLSNHGSLHLEYPIHTELLRAREDVNAVVHTHPPYSIIIGCTAGELYPVSHDALALINDLVISDQYELIISSNQGKRLAQDLGKKNAAILKNHGIVVVGESIEAACVRAVLLEKSAKIQCNASKVGEFKYISPQEAESMRKNKWNDAMLKRMWEYLIRKAERFYHAKI